MQNIKDNKKSLKIKAKQGKLSLKVVNYIKNQWRINKEQPSKTVHSTNYLL